MNTYMHLYIYINVFNLFSVLYFFYSYIFLIILFKNEIDINCRNYSRRAYLSKVWRNPISSFILGSKLSSFLFICKTKPDPSLMLTLNCPETPAGSLCKVFDKAKLNAYT